MSDLLSKRCSETYPHEPHFFVTFWTGGEPGPIPTKGYVCPGIIKESK